MEIKFNFKETLASAFTAAKELGVDQCLYLIVAVGSFASLLLKVEPSWIALIDFIILGGWLANKVVSAYLLERKEDRELQKLKLTEGVKLLEVHKDLQRRLPLPGKGRLKNGNNGLD